MKQIPNILKKITATKVQEVQKLPSIDELQSRLNNHATKVYSTSFSEALKSSIRKPALIAEIKYGSPSAGRFSIDLSPAEVAAEYQRSGAAALSVLTDKEFFYGNKENISLIKKSLDRKIGSEHELAVLRKDFIIDQKQLFESKLLGADAVLLIASLLEYNQAKEYLDIAKSLDLDVLFETHTPDELEMALALKTDVIGINVRDLTDFSVDINRFSTLTLPYKEELKDRLLVAESGIKIYKDVEKAHLAGADAILVGTTFMKSQNIKKTIEKLYGKDKT